MFSRKNKQRARERATEYETCKDFQRIFTEDMVGLHRLAFLLTADQAKAEQCFVAGLEESIRGNPVFRRQLKTLHEFIRGSAPSAVNSRLVDC